MPPLPSDLDAKLASASFATFGHYIDSGFADFGIRRFSGRGKLVGRARTVRVSEADSRIVSLAASLVQPDDVLVVDMCGDTRHACIGAITACAVQQQGGIGVVVDGLLTDIAELRESGLSAFARGLGLRTTKARDNVESAVNVPVTCGGVVVQPGDLVLADDNGVLFMTSGVAEAWIDRVLESDAREPLIIERLKRGERLTDILLAP